MDSALIERHSLPVAVSGSNIRSAVTAVTVVRPPIAGIITAVSIAVVRSPIMRVVAAIAIVGAPIVRVTAIGIIGAIVAAIAAIAVIWRCGGEREAAPERQATKAPTPSASTPVRLGRCDAPRP